MRVYNNNLLVCDPAVRVIKVPSFNLKTRRHEIKGFNLAFPYLYFWTNYTVGYVGMSKNPLNPEKDNMIYPLPLPNNYEDGHVCGVRAESGVEFAKKFWASRFTEENSGYLGDEGLRHSTMKNLNMWEKLTQVDPMFILKENCNYGTKPILLSKTLFVEKKKKKV